ncbi:MAG: RIP metalloprotease RseP, partial [Gemmatimonadota bacterium]
MLTTILATVVVLGVLILVHELGHFWAAKAVDIEVPRFSIGIGPKAVGFRPEGSETEYVLSWLPLGGYVRMAGMEEDEALEGIEGESADEEREPSPRDFDAKPLWARTLVISAGVIMNFLFAVVAYASVAAVWGVPPEPEAAVGDVQEEYLPEGAFALSGVEPGTRIESVNGEAVGSWRDVRIALLTSRDSTLRFGLEGGRELEVTVPAGDSVRQVLTQAIQPAAGVGTTVDRVLEGSPADSAGIRSGDRIVQVAGTPVREWTDVSQGVERRPGDTVGVVVERDGRRVRLSVVPEVNVRAAGGDTLRFGRIGEAPQVGRDRL